MNRPLSNPWISGAPILMSLSVLAIVAYEFLKSGQHSPLHAAGAVDHVAILLMFGQIPIFAVSVMAQRRDLVNRAPALLAQMALWGLAFACASLQ